MESAFTLVTRAHSKRKDYKNGKVDKIQYYVNDGVYGSFHAHANDREPAKPKILDQVNTWFELFSTILPNTYEWFYRNETQALFTTAQYGVRLVLMLIRFTILSFVVEIIEMSCKAIPFADLG